MLLRHCFEWLQHCYAVLRWKLSLRIVSCNITFRISKISKQYLPSSPFSCDHHGQVLWKITFFRKISEVKRRANLLCVQENRLYWTTLFFARFFVPFFFVRLFFGRISVGFFVRFLVRVFPISCLIICPILCLMSCLIFLSDFMSVFCPVLPFFVWFFV